MQPKDIIQRFDLFLEREGKKFSAVVVGAAALNIMGVIKRQTVDFDILEPILSPEIQELAATFRKKLSLEGFELEADWINNGPYQLQKLLPKGWEKRTQNIFVGKAIKLLTLERSDLIRTKLFGYCNRYVDIGDLIALKPSSDELEKAAHWVADQKGGADWKEWVNDRLRYLLERI